MIAFRFRSRRSELMLLAPLIRPFGHLLPEEEKVKGGHKKTGAQASPPPAVSKRHGSEKAIDELRHGRNRHVPCITLAVDQEGRRRIDAEVFGCAFPN